MHVSARSSLMAGVAAIGATAIAIAPSVQPPAPVAATPPTVQLAAQPFPLAAQTFQRAAQTLAARTAQTLATQPQQAVTPQLGPVTGYIVSWIDYGVSVTAGAVSYIPVIGPPIADQININYFNLIRPLAVNVADFARSVVQSPLNLVNDVVNLGIGVGRTLYYYASAQLQFFTGFPLPPLPGLPPLAFSAPAAQGSTLAGARSASTPTTPTGLVQLDKLEKVTAEAVSETRTALTNLVTIPKAMTNAATGASDEVSKDDLGQTDVAKAVVTAPRKLARGAVQAQSEVRGTVVNEVNEAAKSVTGESGTTQKSVVKAPGTVVKNLRDGVERAAGAVAKVRSDVRKAVKAAQSDSEE